MPDSGAYEAFRAELYARHQHPMTSLLSTVGDSLFILGLLAVLPGRRYRAGAAGMAAGVTAAVVAHLFQPGTLKDELKAISTHPLHAAMAERERVCRR